MEVKIFKQGPYPSKDRSMAPMVSLLVIVTLVIGPWDEARPSERH